MDKKYVIEARIKDVDLKFETFDGVFSPREIDRGTLAMLSQFEFEKEEMVLDIGCGYGVVGILASKLIGPEKVVMSDIDESAVELARKNAILNGVDAVKIYQSEGFKAIDQKDFTIILSNPPYHTDFSVAKEFIEKGFNRLAIGGRMFMVTKRRDWYKNKFISIFGGVKISEIDGYQVFMAVKKEASYSKSKNKRK